MTVSAIDAALNAIWAMEPSALETLLRIAAREHEVSPEALEAYRAKTLDKAEQATVRDGVAILTANGPMIRRASFFSAISGATSYDVLMRDLTAARDDPKVKAIVFCFDTPGGDANQVGELAAAIRAVTRDKPVIAYVGSQACSAGYWLAAACSEVVVDATAILGSIGVQMAMRDTADPKGVTTYRFVSSQSPMKNADPGTAEGAAHIQGVVDAMAQVFVESVAAYRGTDTETVLSNFGKGGIFVGVDAVNAGLADRIGSFEGVIAELSAPRRKSTKGAKMADETTFTQAQLDEAVAKAVAASNTANAVRERDIRRIAAGAALPAGLLERAIARGTTVEAFALEVSDLLAAGRARRAEASAAAAADAELDAWVASVASDAPYELPSSGDAELDAVAARIAAA